MPNLPKTQAQYDNIKVDYNRDRKSAKERGYGSRWQRIRSAYITKHPLCERCKMNGYTKIAELVHHKDRDTRNNSYTNLESLCTQCHDAEHKHDRFKPKER